MNRVLGPADYGDVSTAPKLQALLDKMHADGWVLVAPVGKCLVFRPVSIAPDVTPPARVRSATLLIDDDGE